MGSDGSAPVAIEAIRERFVPGLKTELEQAKAHQMFLRGQLQQQEKIVKDVETAIKALGGDISPKPKIEAPQPPRRNTQKNGGVSTGFGITMESAAEAVAAIKEFVADDNVEFFTQRMVYDQLGWNQSRCSAVFKYLRSIEYVRKAGKEPGVGGSERWAVLDADAFDKAMEIAQKETANA